MRARFFVVIVAVTAAVSTGASSVPLRAKRGMVSSQNEFASKVGADVIKDGGTAVDAVVATAFALAVTHPTAGNIGGGGFIVYRPASGDPVAYDFREKAPAKASPTMWMKNGQYSPELHHESYLAVGVPGTVAGLHLAWKEQGKLPWKRLVEPAVTLARDGFVISDNFARSLKSVQRVMQKYPASVAAFTKNGVPYEGGETLKQPDLAKTLERIATQGPAGFYEGETALLMEKEMAAHGGLITREDLKNYSAARRVPVKGTYRGYDVISMPPPSSGGVGIVEMLNILEGYDVKAMGFGSAAQIHVMAESMKRAYADRAKFLGDPDFNKEMPLARLMSKDYAGELRKTINPDHASKPSPTKFDWTHESDETTQISVVDASRNAVSMTYTLEQGYGVKIVVPGAGFLLNNEMGDFNAAPEMTTEQGLIGTKPNLTEPGKRMLSSMSPTILAKDGKLFMVTGSPGGRTIINTVLETIVDAVDFGMNAQEAVDAPRFHHQWLPDVISYERFGFSPDTVKELERRGQTLREGGGQGVAQIIIYDAKNDVLEGGNDRRAADGAAVGVQGSSAARTSSAGQQRFH
ncbi:MAG TPA: gamma-glutamyltransferase [Vicinamibacterales bacterium]|jgi:gamma-glutamyltranspeptidase/glutathione hydrolase